MNRIKIDPRVCVLFSVIILLVPLQWLVAWLTAVCFHEFCHWIFIKLFGGNILTFSIGLGGANMQCTDLSDNVRLISILAGPVGGLVLVLFGRWFPRLAVCSWLLSVYNFLPILPLDGGQTVRILMKNDKSFFVLERIILHIITLLTVFICIFTNFGPLPLVVTASLWLKNRKRPCKETFCGVQ